MSSAFDEPIEGGVRQEGGQAVGQGAGGETSPNQKVVLLTYAFKTLALLIYLFGGFISSNFAFQFVLVVLALSCDAYVTTNIAGRLLVGMRWWSRTKEDGSSEWIFESKPASKTVHPSDSFAFWASIYGTPVVWTVLGIVAIASLSVKSLLIVAVALVLSGSNLVGYMKCSKDAKKQLQGFIISQM